MAAQGTDGPRPLRFGPIGRTTIRAISRRARPQWDWTAILVVWLAVLMIGSVVLVPAVGTAQSATDSKINTAGSQTQTHNSLGIGPAAGAGLPHVAYNLDDDDTNGKANGKTKEKAKGKDKDKNKNKNGNNGKAKGNPGGPIVKVTVEQSDDKSGKNGAKGTNGKNVDRSNDTSEANGANAKRSNDKSKANGKNVDRSNDTSGPAEVQKKPGKSKDRWKSKVNVAVSGVEEGDTVPMDVSTRETEDDEAAFDAITTRVTRAENFTMNITTSPDRLTGSPAFTPDDGADSMAHIRLDHSITNDEVDNVSFMFRVSKQRLAATDTEIREVALYRYANGTWNALPTKPVGETETHYVFSVESPGMSEFAIATQQPKFDLWHAEVGANAVTQSQSITVNGRVTNVGAADGVFTAKLMSKQMVVERQQITIASGGTRQVNFDRSFDRPGDYEIMINDVHAGTITVEPADTSDDRDASVISVFLSRWFDIERT